MSLCHFSRSYRAYCDIFSKFYGHKPFLCASIRIKILFFTFIPKCDVHTRKSPTHFVETVWSKCNPIFFFGNLFLSKSIQPVLFTRVWCHFSSDFHFHPVVCSERAHDCIYISMYVCVYVNCNTILSYPHFAPIVVYWIGFLVFLWWNNINLICLSFCLWSTAVNVRPYHYWWFETIFIVFYNIFIDINLLCYILLLLYKLCFTSFLIFKRLTITFGSQHLRYLNETLV